MISNVYHIPLEELIDHNGEALSQEDFHLIGRAMLEAKMYYEAAQVGFCSDQCILVSDWPTN